MNNIFTNKYYWWVSPRDWAVIRVKIEDIIVNEGREIASVPSLLFSKKNYPDLVPSIWLNEPTGYPIDPEELFESKEDALKSAQEITLNWKTEHPNGTEEFDKFDLIDWRMEKIKFIKSTGNKLCHLRNYVEKVQNVDWFDLDDFTHNQ